MLKKIILWLHKWCGIITGIVVFILGTTGCIYTFQDELKLWAYPEKYMISDTSVTVAPLPLSTLLSNAQNSLGKDQKITRIDLYPAKNRTWIFRALKTDETAFGHWNYYSYFKRVFINPYTGKVQHIENSKTEFFQLMLQLHLNLLLGKKYGHPIVGWSTTLFVLILLSGIILWWPKKWKGKTLRRSLWLDTKVKWKRLNHDLHNVIGFYSLLVGLIFAITGLLFTFPTFKNIYINAFNAFSKTENTAKAVHNAPLPLRYDHVQDNALVYAMAQYPRAEMLSIRLKKESDQEIDIQVRRYEKRTGVFHWLYFDPKTAHLTHVKSGDQLPLGDKLATLNFDLHTGSIGGLITKVIAFIFSLFCASLPITGYMIWLNKSRKKKKKKLSTKC
ncbi:PepSY domain-containing protein [Sphingobacterium sp. N143]|uniref:PepSY-associated TM helix domain-containing protein n=1 Tax=Sphingobacterium sp. N143 TaxID=2746727 RepID=UPI002578CB0F|nr:PepSY-associated TM helix domain-containing protein [Sphingobacterium sp. N143]MDM1294561.1 PepSY domain-containing protein [Sphingobacterium sp. N143]